MLFRDLVLAERSSRNWRRECNTCGRGTWKTNPTGSAHRQADCLIPTGRDKLALILFYLKVYPSFDVLGVLSGINGPESCRWVYKLMPLLEKLLGQKLMLPKRSLDWNQRAIAIQTSVTVNISSHLSSRERAKLGSFYTPL
ncbi:MAG: transposase family protein [Puniceicoccales bacterium]|jgi:hypothetical protein|nr:transposase family protein [Puniceicoccales bacterium]